jgi:hypothetical protein
MRAAADGISLPIPGFPGRPKPATLFFAVSARAAAVVALLVGLSPPAAAQEGDCLSEVRLEGPGAARGALLAALEPGLLSGTPTGPCAGARVAIAPEGEGYWLRLEQGDRAIERHAATVEAAAVWVESWLAPSYASDPASADDAAAAQALAAVEEAPPPPLVAATVDAAAGRRRWADGAAAEPEEPSGPEPPSVVLQMQYVTSVDIERQLWVGPSIDLHFPIGRSLWLGVALQANRQVGEARGVTEAGRSAPRHHACTGGRCTDVEMYNLTAMARFGGRLTRERFFLRGGIGIGFVGGASSMQHVELSVRSGDDEIGPATELFAEAGVRLGRSGFHLVFGLTGRANLNEGRDWDPDEALYIPGRDPAVDAMGNDIEHSNQVMPPLPVPRALFDARIGIAWAFGGDR